MEQHLRLNKINYGIILIILLVYPYGVSFISNSLLFYLSVLLIGGFSIFLLKQQGYGNLFKLHKVSWRNSVKIFLGFVALMGWSMVAHHFLPSPQNEQALDSFSATGIDLIMFYLYSILIGPISEEIVFRGLVMKNLKDFSSFGFDILISASLFSLGHVLTHGFIWTDFIVYFGLGIIFSFIFKNSKTLYPSITLHILWNGFLFWISG